MSAAGELQMIRPQLHTIPTKHLLANATHHLIAAEHFLHYCVAILIGTAFAFADQLFIIGSGGGRQKLIVRLEFFVVVGNL